MDDYRLICRGMLTLVTVRRLLRRGDLGHLRRYISSRHAADCTDSVSATRILRAVQRAESLSRRRSTCLHRSATLVKLLRAYGQRATLLLGVASEPYRGHAWVEWNGGVFGDESMVRDDYIVVAEL